MFELISVAEMSKTYIFVSREVLEMGIHSAVLHFNMVQMVLKRYCPFLILVQGLQWSLKIIK